MWMRNMDYCKIRIEAFQVWCYQEDGSMISWTDSISSEDVLESVYEKKSIRKSQQKKQNKLIGHIFRHNGLLLLILKGIINGKNRGARQRLLYTSQIIEDQGCNSHQELKKEASDRETCKFLQINWIEYCRRLRISMLILLLSSVLGSSCRVFSLVCAFL